MTRKILMCTLALTLLLFFAAPMISASTETSVGTLVGRARLGALPDFEGAGGDGMTPDDWLDSQGVKNHEKPLVAYGATEPCIEDDCCVHITDEGSVGRVQVDDCPRRGWDVRYVLADALGTLKIDMEHTNVKLDPNARLSLSKDEIWGLLAGATATITLSPEISMKLDFYAMKGVLSLPEGFTGILDIPTWTASIPLPGALEMSLNIQKRTATFSYTASGLSQTFGPFGLGDAALKEAVDNLETAGLIDEQTKQGLTGLLAATQATLASIGELATVTDISALIPDYNIPLSEFDLPIKDSADWSNEIMVPYSFGFSYTDLRGGATAEFRLREDVLDVSWPGKLSQSIEEENLALGQLREFLVSLFPESFPQEETLRILSELIPKEYIGLIDIETGLMEDMLGRFRDIVNELVALPSTGAGLPPNMTFDFGSSSMDSFSKLVGEKTAEWIGVILDGISIDIDAEIEFLPGNLTSIVLLGTEKEEAEDDSDLPDLPYTGGFWNTPLFLLIGADFVLGGLVLGKKEKAKSRTAGGRDR